MLSKILKLVGIAFGGVSLYVVGNVVLSTIYAAGYQEGEIVTLNILSELDRLCGGMSSEYIEQFNDWKKGITKYRLCSFDVTGKTSYNKIKYLDNAMNFIKSRDKIIANQTDLENNPVIDIYHQALIRHWIINNTGEEEIIELRFHKNDDVKFDNRILTKLAVLNNVLFIDREDSFSFVGIDESVYTFGTDFWTNYNLMALDFGKECIPIGRYTADKITRE